MKKSTVFAVKNAPRFVDDSHVLVTKAFAKNARIFGTPEYKMWRAMCRFNAISAYFQWD